MPTVIEDGSTTTTITGQGSTTVGAGTTAGASTLDRLRVSFTQLATEQTWVAAAVNWFVRQSYRCPLEAVEILDAEQGETRHLDDDDPVARFVGEPWRGAGRGDLPAALIGSLQVEGNGFAEIDSGAGESLVAVPRLWRDVSWRLGDHPWTVEGWLVKRRAVVRDRALHVAFWSPKGAVGVSPLQQLSWTVRAEQAAQEWTLANLLNGARPDGVVKISDEMLPRSPEEKRAIMDQVTEQLRGAFSGPSNAGKLPVLPPGVEWADTSRTTAVEAELVRQRELNREEVAAIYGLPPVVLGILDEANYNNLESLIPYAATAGLGPVLQLVEQRTTACLRALTGRPAIAVRFNMTSMLRGDFLKEVRAGRDATGVPTWTPQEFRDRFGLRRLDAKGIDDLWVQSKSNVAPMGSPDAPKPDSTEDP